MSADNHRDIQLFHEKMEVPTVWENIHRVKHDVLQLRYNLVYEEAGLELLPALKQFAAAPTLENLVAVADGLVDTVVVTLGTAVALELPWEELWNEVQRSNMAKLQPDGSVKRREDGKILKPEGWTPPDLHSILMKWLADRQASTHQPINSQEVITPEQQARLIGQWQARGANPTAKWDESAKQYAGIKTAAAPAAPTAQVPGLPEAGAQ